MVLTDFRIIYLLNQGKYFRVIRLIFQANLSVILESNGKGEVKFRLIKLGGASLTSISKT